MTAVRAETRAEAAPAAPEPSDGPLALPTDVDPTETSEWLASLDAVLANEGTERAGFLLDRLIERARSRGTRLSYAATTPYVNTIPASAQPEYPGDRHIERRIKSILRWNAIAMVLRANRRSPGVGGHISTYASAATLYEVGFNHFFRGSTGNAVGDQIFYQGHASPGIYARAFLEGRISEALMENFRGELLPGGGLSSYPHPWLMPDFWEFPTVSMGLGPIVSIYQARFNRYLQNRGIANTDQTRVWCFVGDGEMDEPESLGAISLAGREQLDNLTWVINCNLQRLDGPVRGNGKIIQELEGYFYGAGWNVIKVIWGSDWDELLANDDEGLLVRRMNETVDGTYQKYSVESGAYIREKFFGVHPKLLQMVAHISDDRMRTLRRGGHDPLKVYAGYHEAVHAKGRPTVLLCKTIKGYGLGDAGEGLNITHQKKSLELKNLRDFRDRFELPIPDDKLEDTPFYHPGPKSPEIEYLLERRRALGGFTPRRVVRAAPLKAPPLAHFKDFLKGSGENREVATTMAFVQILNTLMKDKEIGDLIVPIVPDEARTFGMDALFRQYGIYAQRGQLYDPVDSRMLLFYREAVDGQLIEEGITEAGGMSSFVAAGTAYATHGVNTIPFFIYYSMFGFQRIGDLIWLNGDARGRGFLLGATAGRTTLNGEGLQHQDGHSHSMAANVPNCLPYDPAFAYELAVIIQDGIRRMYQERESVFYYITVYNEKHEMPAMPEGVEAGILKGIYKFKAAAKPGKKPRVHLFGSGPQVLAALQAQELLEAKFDVAADVWSVTSYTLLRRDALDAERWNLLHPGGKQRKPYLTELLEKEPFPVIAVSDNVKGLADGIGKYVPGGLHALGTDGYGRSSDRARLRRHFEIDAEFIALAALHQLAQGGAIPPAKVKEAMKELGIDPARANPASA